MSVDFEQQWDPKRKYMLLFIVGTDRYISESFIIIIVANHLYNIAVIRHLFYVTHLMLPHSFRRLCWCNLTMILPDCVSDEYLTTKLIDSTMFLIKYELMGQMMVRETSCG